MAHARGFPLSRNWTPKVSASRESVGVPAVESPAAGFVRRQPVFSGMFCRRGDVTVTTMNAAAARRRHPRVALRRPYGAHRARPWPAVRRARRCSAASACPARRRPRPRSPHRAAAAAAARQGVGGADHRRAGCDRQADPSGVHERDRDASASPSSPARKSGPTTRCAATSSRPRTRPPPRSPTSGTSPIPSGKRVNRITGEEVVVRATPARTRGRR